MKSVGRTRETASVEAAARPRLVKDAPPERRIKFEVYGEEVLEKQVAGSGRVGRVYLPLEWLGKKVKIIRMD